MENANDALTAAFFKFWKDSYTYLKSENKESSSKDFKRSSITNYLSDGIAYSVAQGLMQYTRIQPRPTQGDQWQPLFPGGEVKIASTTFLPSPYPKSQFQYAKKLAPLFNQLANNLSNEPSWLIEQLKPMAMVDDYIRRLLDICQRVYVDGEKDFRKALKLHLFRSDYMTHLEMNGDKPSLSIKQIELNVVSVSCASYVNSLSPIHKVQIQNILQSTPFFDSLEAINETHPSNHPLHEFGSAFYAAQKAYKERYQPKHPLAVVWLVDPNDLNEVDHRQLAFTLQYEYGLNLIRATFNELYSMKNNGTLFLGHDSKNAEFNDLTENNYSKVKNLYITETLGPWEGAAQLTHEVAIIYLRSGYSPDHFTSEENWEIYEWLENTEAIKVPAVPTLLSGMKKIQQACCDHQTLSMFTKFAHDIEPCFALQVDCNDTSALAMETMYKAIKTPENYVLKPQREGGGNNLHEGELADALKSHLEKISKKDSNSEFTTSSEYILMEKVKPPELPTIHYRTPYPSKENPRPLTKPECIESVGELGIYGAAVYDGEIEVMNKYAGYLMRTKSSKENEGGFVTGVSSMDSIFLYDDAKFLKFLLKSIE